MTFFHRVALLSAAVAVASPAMGQQPTSPSRTDSAKPQVQTFEMVLKTAVETGGQNFARRAAEITPDIAALSFSPGESPVVSGIADHDLGLYVFQVQVPGVSLTLTVMNMMMNRPTSTGRPPGAQPVGSSGRVAADVGVVASDPMTSDSAAPRPDYRLQVRGALIDAILDNSGGLPLLPTDTLLVYASGIEGPAGFSSLLKVPVIKDVFKASGADLIAFRLGKLSRDEAKQRIKITSF